MAAKKQEAAPSAIEVHFNPTVKLSFDLDASVLTVDAARAISSVILERKRQITDKGYSRAHDDELGHAHLVSETVDRLTHLGEVSSPAAVRHDLVAAATMLVAAIEVIDRQTPEQTDPGSVAS